MLGFYGVRDWNNDWNLLVGAIMKRRIYKAVLELTDAQEITVERGAKPLCVQMQGENPCLWYATDIEQPVSMATVFIIGTGNPIPNDVSTDHYIGTFQLYGGTLVFHAFWREGEAS